MTPQQTIAKAKKIEWEYLVNRKEALLMKSLTAGSHEYMPRVTRIPMRPLVSLRIGGEVFFNADGLAAVRSYFATGDLKRFINFRRRLLRYVGGFARIARSLRERDFSRVTQKQLSAALERYLFWCLRATAFLVPVPLAGNALLRMMMDALPPASPEEKERWAYTLSYPVKENAHTKEERSFYALAAACARHPKRCAERMQQHAQQFGWIGARQFWFHEAWTPADIKKRIANVHRLGKDPKILLRTLDEERMHVLRDATELMRRFGVWKASRLGKLIAIAREYAYLRTWRTDMIYGSGYWARGLFEEIVQRAGLPKTAAPYCTYHELRAMVKTHKAPFSLAELTRRIQAGKENMVSIAFDDISHIFVGKRWLAYFQKAFRHLERKGNAATLKGNVAFAGVVRGTVKVLYSSDDIAKVQRGDILIATMTFPNYIPAMEKAAAFVTDEGGILCHAAIVSREMKKPCIIGTKIATKVFKDGDRVEVDAEKGIVRKLS